VLVQYYVEVEYKTVCYPIIDMSNLTKYILRYYNIIIYYYFIAVLKIKLLSSAIAAAYTTHDEHPSHT